MKTMNTNIRMILATALLALTATTAQARSWRINNNVKQKPDFIDINAAMSSEDVVAGDTLYMDPGCNLIAAQNVTKQVTIIGCGYEGNDVPYGQTVISGRLNIKAADTKVISVVTTEIVYIMANNVTLERCRTYRIRTSGDNCKNAVIRQCYCNFSGGDPVIEGAGKENTKSAFWTIENCIVLAGNTYYDPQCINGLYNATIRNNLLVAYYGNTSYSGYTLRDIGKSLIQNNIIIHTTNASRALYNVDTDQLSNNVISSNTRTEYNRSNVLTTDSVYNGNVQSYVLTEDSPAKNYGADGTDCGIFGGLYPYVKGGLPYGHPYYTRYNISSRADEKGKVKVSLNIKMQDE